MTTIDPRAVMRLYEAELHAIGEMLTTVGVPENDDDGHPISPRLRVRVLIDQLAINALCQDRPR